MYYIMKEFSPNIQSKRVVYVLHPEGIQPYHSDQ